MITVRELLEAGAHFGHQTRRWNPKMKRFIFTARNGIYIIDLQKTILSIKMACDRIREIVGNGGKLLFVGTKKQAKGVIREEATRCGMFHVTERWLGGTLTNFQTIKINLKRLQEIENMRQDGTFEKLTKKEVLKLEKEHAKLEKVLGGIRQMYSLPDMMYVVDCKKEKIAVAEATKLGIPVVAIIDTNSDPDPISYPIAANDDAIKSIAAITRQIADAVLEAEKRVSEEEMNLEAASPQEETLNTAEKQT